VNDGGKAGTDPAAPVVTADAAGTWQLGGLVVNRLGFGAMRLTQRGPAFGADAAPSDRAQAIAVLRRAVQLGVNHIDTAAFYFSALRSANELINSALAPYPDDLVIVSKVGPGRGPSGEWTDAARPDQLRSQVEENLRQLGRDHLDVVNLRRMPSMGPSIAEHFGALADLRDTGLIRYLGVSGVTPVDLADARAIAPVACVQNAFGFGRSNDPLLQICGQEGIAFVPFFAIAGSGRHRGPDNTVADNTVADNTVADNTVADRLLAIAQAHDATPAQVRLAWTLHQGQHVLAIPGTGDPAHLAHNVAAAGLRLSPAELSELDALA
jgi:aryl-alcohol dehydrogenase-like predicted oxidoreductase